MATQIRSYSGDLSSTIDNMLANMGTDQIKGIIEFVLSSDNTDDVMQALMANEAIRTTLLNHAQYSVKLLPILINNNTLKNQVLPQIPTIISNLANQGIAV